MWPGRACAGAIVRRPGCSLPRPRRRGTAAAAWPAGPLARPPCRRIPSGRAAGFQHSSHHGGHVGGGRAVRLIAFHETDGLGQGGAVDRIATSRLRRPAAGREVRLDVARLDQRHMHAKGRHLVRKCFTQTLQSELARAVESLERDADHAADGAHQHDAPAALRPHGGQHLLQHSHAAPEVRLQLGLCLLDCALLDRTGQTPSAEATSASMRPPAASMPATPERTESSSSTSMTRPAHPPEVVPRLLAPVTAQPAACNSSAQALPMPADAPVTSARLAPSLMGAPISQPAPTARRTSQSPNRMTGARRASKNATRRQPGLLCGAAPGRVIEAGTPGGIAAQAPGGAGHEDSEPHGQVQDPAIEGCRRPAGNGLAG